jgi:hypothetical protein
MSLLASAFLVLLAIGQDPAPQDPGIQPPADVAPVVVRPSAERPSSDGRGIRVKPGSIGLTDLDRISCRREAPVGSRRKVKVCDTSLGWRRRADQAEQLMDPGRRTNGPGKRGGEEP